MENLISEFYADCYVLSGNRTCKFLNDFLNHFIPNQKEMADEYRVPTNSNAQDIVFKSWKNICRYLEINKSIYYAIYWRNMQKSSLKVAEVFYTTDGFVIYGLSCITHYHNKEIEMEYLQMLKKFCHSDIDLIVYEDIPPETSAEFIQQVKIFNESVNEQE